MRSPSKPRYLVKEKGKGQPRTRPLPFKPASPLRGWVRAIAGIVLSTAIPYALLWGGNLVLNPYRVFFDERPSNVTLDGRTVALDSANGFGLSRFALGEHRVGFTDAQGVAKTVVFRARLGDDVGSVAIYDHRIEGVPKATFVGN